MGDEYPISVESILENKTLVNTWEFRRSALHFLRHGCYTKAPKGSTDYYSFWKRETDRCINGYKVGDLWISGKFYFYLNYIPIKKIPDSMYLHVHPNAAKNIKVDTFPSFWQVDRMWWELKELASRNAEAGRKDCHIVVLKTRRAGFSYKEAVDGIWNYTFIPKSSSKYYAFSEGYLIKDGIFNKVGAMLDYINSHTYWRQLRQRADSTFYKKAQYLDTNTGTYKGRQSELIAQTLNDPEKARGGDSLKITFEEAGSFKGLLKAWEVCLPQVTQGGITTGLMTAFGTGNNSANDEYIASLEELFYNPKAYNVISFPNIWDEGLEDTECGFFVPTTLIREQHMDADGNIDLEVANEEVLKEREARAGTKNEDLNRIENPLTPTEALKRISNAIIPPYLKEAARLRLLELEQLGIDSVKAKIVRNTDNKTAQLKVLDGNPFNEYPVKKGTETTNKDWCWEIYEPIIKDSMDNIPGNLYFIVHDPYLKDVAPESRSIGAAQVWRNEYRQKVDGKIKYYPPTQVASLYGRPRLKKTYNDQLFNGAIYWNAKIQFEVRGGGSDVITYARDEGLLYKLEEDITYTSATESRSKTIRYGLHNSVDDSDTMLMNLVEFLSQELDDGSLTVEHIKDRGLLREIAKHTENSDYNFDRIDAAKQVPLMYKEYNNRKIQSRNKKTQIFNRRLKRRVIKKRKNYIGHV